MSSLSASHDFSKIYIPPLNGALSTGRALGAQVWNGDGEVGYTTSAGGHRDAIVRYVLSLGGQFSGLVRDELRL